MQAAVRQLLMVAPMLTDELDEASLKAARELLDELDHPLSKDDVLALLSVLPTTGDTAYGLNWTVVHAIEAAPSWPIWSALASQDNEWAETLRLRLESAGKSPRSS
jgi:hypothetical protein